MTQLESYLQEVKERAEKAAPGSWMACLGSGQNECTAISFEGNAKYPNGIFICDLIPDYVLEGAYKEDLKFKVGNMDFIIHSRTDIPKLLAMLEIAVEGLKNLNSKRCKAERCACCEIDGLNTSIWLSKIEEIVARK